MVIDLLLYNNKKETKIDWNKPHGPKQGSKDGWLMPLILCCVMVLYRSIVTRPDFLSLCAVIMLPHPYVFSISPPSIMRRFTRLFSMCRIERRVSVVNLGEEEGCKGDTEGGDHGAADGTGTTGEGGEAGRDVSRRSLIFWVY